MANKACTVSNVILNLQNGTDRTMYMTWSFSKKYLDHFVLKWEYDTGNGVWFIGANDVSTTDRQCIFNAPSNAARVRACIKPVSKTYKKNGKKRSRWTSQWCDAQYYTFPDSPSANPLPVPSVPSVTISGFSLTAEVNDYEARVQQIEFQVVQNDQTLVASGIGNKVTDHAAFSCNVAAGGSYKVRCRGLGSGLTSEWSEYSQNVGTIPSTPTGITECYGLSESSVRVGWQAVSNATSYEVEYTTNADYFDSSNETQTMTVQGSVQHAEVTGLDSGKTWFFRVRAVNDKGQSGWTGAASAVIGKTPSPPTTWSLTTTAMVGETVTLSWVHNSEDSSEQSAADLELIVNGVSQIIPISGKTSTYALQTSSYADGTKVYWRVRTKGAIPTYSEWSMQRVVDIYAPPVLTVTLDSNVLSSFPLRVHVSAEPKTQTPVGYYLSITPKTSYETTDFYGKTVWIKAGETVYSKHYDIRDKAAVFEITASDVTLENNVEYIISCTVAMSTGLTASNNVSFSASWTDEDFELNAEVGVDTGSLTAYICPFCQDEAENIIEGILLSVYRREFDGTFTELARNIENGKNITITDPHPALDYARYRIVGMSKETSSISYYDLPGIPVGETAIVIQWDEEWSNFDVTEEAEMVEPTWAGSLVKFPYNNDISDDYSPDVALVNYIGRSHPVSYYGTQIGETATWSAEILIDDEDTLYALRRLARWMGDCYVREPSGSGYWANVKVSFSRKHCALTIPVTLSITRVEGGA